MEREFNEDFSALSQALATILPPAQVAECPNPLIVVLTQQMLSGILSPANALAGFAC
jgi:hypothetical protein